MCIRGTPETVIYRLIPNTGNTTVIHPKKYQVGHSNPTEVHISPDSY